MYQLINISFFVFHIGLILFNLFGWLFESTRKWNLLTLAITAFSWSVLGIFYGLGYCFLTDWHWEVREKLGYATTSDSYIHFLITAILPIDISEEVVNWLTAILFVAAFTMSIITNARSLRKKSKKRNG